MSRHPKPKGSKGSLKLTQILVNQYPDYLNALISRAIKKNRTLDIKWVSPKEDDRYAEYRDEQFLERLGISDLKVPLKQFWPRMGPQWDALGKGPNGEIFLVEAKANIPEFISDPSGAEKPSSRRLILRSLRATRKYLEVSTKNKTKWNQYFYQYSNRLAHLYYFRERNNIKAFLIWIYFINDISTRGPSSKAEWQAAIKVAHKLLGYKKNKKSGKYITEIFIDVSSLSNNKSKEPGSHPK